MKHIKETIKYFTSTCIIILLSYCCWCQEAFMQDKKTWKEDCVEKLTIRYLEYDKNYTTICDSIYRDRFFDYYRKVQSILEFPFIDVASSFKNYTIINGIEFDSICMNLIQNPVFTTPEFSNPQIIFDIISNGREISYYVLMDELTVAKIEKINEHKYLNKIVNVPNDGCEPGYTIATWFDRDWNWSIEKIIINPKNIISN